MYDKLSIITKLNKRHKCNSGFIICLFFNFNQFSEMRGLCMLSDEERRQLVKVENLTNTEKFTSPKVSPLAQIIANSKGIELSTIQGTGHQQKIMKKDVVAPAPMPRMVLFSK